MVFSEDERFGILKVELNDEERKELEREKHLSNVLRGVGIERRKKCRLQMGKKVSETLRDRVMTIETKETMNEGVMTPTII